ncbi:MAG: YceI family protein [Anaerolineae bacterium]|nr:YceI family protein [Anaerolineae bacterium]
MTARTLVYVIVALIVGAVGGILGFVWTVGGTGEASAPISAPTLDINAIPTLNPTQAFAAVTQVADLSSQVTDLQATIEALSAAQSTADAEQPTPEPTAEAAAAAAVEAPAAERSLYRIDAASSLVTFALQEDLRGVRTDVIGQTTEVAGDIVIDFGNPASSQVGTIRINARTLATDNEFRNRALRSEILRTSSDDYEFIDFEPTAINGLPATVAVGETYTFDVVGNLTVVGVTNEVTFTAQVTIASADQITGTATTNINYGDWGIAIPNAPGVANVTPDVTLTLDFTADQVPA